MPPLTPKEVRKAARAAISIFNDYEISCCLFGSLACHIYGMRNRDPKDVDLIVLNDQGNDPEALKEILVDQDDRFFFVASRDPNATYRVLWFEVSRGRECKVDILTTGRSTALDIPRVPDSRTMFIHPFNDLPLMPLLALLLLKLRGWTDHRHSSKKYEQEKVRQDVTDIREMLEIAIDQGESIGNRESRWMPKWFITQMGDRVDEYIRKFPASQAQWENLGL
ncbi:hypothetical protein GYMLUDRAFT_536008 [Collybiopsis luxurians FD-317 M1]|nr:hypothetical protein GYMLUDRAFT_536008 [Collybiopsis luxurians FD-317 M1]